MGREWGTYGKKKNALKGFRSKARKGHTDVDNSIQFNSIQFFIIYVPSQQLQGQLQTQHSVDTIIIIIIVKQYSNNND
jgi:hypothetical protein